MILAAEDADRRDGSSVLADDLVARGGRRVDRARSLKDPGAGRGVNPPHAVELVVVNVGAVRGLEPGLARVEARPGVGRVPALADTYRREAGGDLGRRRRDVFALDLRAAAAIDDDALDVHVRALGAVRAKNSQHVACGTRPRHSGRGLARPAAEVRVGSRFEESLGAGGEVVRRHPVEWRIAVRVDGFDIGTFGDQERHLTLVARRHAAVVERLSAAGAYVVDQIGMLV